MPASRTSKHGRENSRSRDGPGRRVRRGRSASVREQRRKSSSATCEREVRSPESDGSEQTRVCRKFWEKRAQRDLEPNDAKEQSTVLVRTNFTRERTSPKATVIEESAKNVRAREKAPRREQADERNGVQRTVPPPAGGRGPVALTLTGEVNECGAAPRTQENDGKDGKPAACEHPKCMNKGKSFAESCAPDKAQGYLHACGLRFCGSCRYRNASGEIPNRVEGVRGRKAGMESSPRSTIQLLRDRFEADLDMPQDKKDCILRNLTEAAKEINASPKSGAQAPPASSASGGMIGGSGGWVAVRQVSSNVPDLKLTPHIADGDAARAAIKDFRDKVDKAYESSHAKSIQFAMVYRAKNMNEVNTRLKYLLGKNKPIPIEGLESAGGRAWVKPGPGCFFGWKKGDKWLGVTRVHLPRDEESRRAATEVSVQLHIAAGQDNHAITVQGTKLGLLSLAGQWTMTLGPMSGPTDSGDHDDFDLTGYGF